MAVETPDVQVDPDAILEPMWRSPSQYALSPAAVGVHVTNVHIVMTAPTEQRVLGWLAVGLVRLSPEFM